MRRPIDTGSSIEGMATKDSPPPVSNQSLYRTTLLADWTERDGLQATERELIDRYLAPGGDTLEAGTGGGRIVRALHELGFRSLTGFDSAPEMIEAAKAKGPTSIRFDVQDASKLSYADEAFDQIIYLEQVLCMIETEVGRRSAIREAYRILRPGGVGLFSFLRWDARTADVGRRLFVRWLRLLRRMRRHDRSIQEQPWLMLAGKPNLWALADRPPYVYWYRESEVEEQLLAAGFERESLVGERYSGRPKGHIWVVCRKPLGAS